LNTTYAWGIVLNSDSDITVFTPVGSPGVLDEVVFDAVFDSIADGENSVVKRDATSWIGNYASEIMLEGVLSSIDSYRDGLLGDGSLQLSSRVSLHRGVLEHRDLPSKCRKARVSDGHIWVLSLGVHLVSHGILEAVLLPATIASLVICDAVNALLL
jgi:hypothetical protein